MPSEVVISEKIRVGCAVEIAAKLLERRRLTPNSPVELEFVGSRINVTGPVAATDVFPLAASHGASSATPELLRQPTYLHLRHRLVHYAAIMRLRAQIKQLLRDFYVSQDYVEVDTPVMTQMDCEGAGETFMVTQLLEKRRENETARETREEQQRETPETHRSSFSPKLSVSGQLHLEACCLGLSHVFAMMPVCRADKSNTRHHLAEFHMLESESMRLASVDALCDHIERLIGHVIGRLRRQTTASDEQFDMVVRDDIQTILQSNLSSGCGGVARATKPVLLDEWSQPSVRLTFAEAQRILRVDDENESLSKQNELDLLAHFGGDKLVFVTHFPASQKPFYVRRCQQQQQSNLSQSVDVLMPNVGEVAGGSVREHDWRRLREQMTELRRRGSSENIGGGDGDVELDANSLWYLELRKYGCPPHGGMGLGIERLLQSLLNVTSVRDVIAFPRHHRSCPL